MYIQERGDDESKTGELGTGGWRKRQTGRAAKRKELKGLYSVDCWTAATSSTSDTEKISEGGLGKMEKIMVLIDSPQSLHNKEH